jgi:hypothetical protein
MVDYPEVLEAMAFDLAKKPSHPWGMNLEAQVIRSRIGLGNAPGGRAHAKAYLRNQGMIIPEGRDAIEDRPG